MNHWQDTNKSITASNRSIQQEITWTTVRTLTGLYSSTKEEPPNHSFVHRERRPPSPLLLPFYFYLFLLVFRMGYRTLRVYCGCAWFAAVDKSKCTQVVKPCSDRPQAYASGYSVFATVGGCNQQRAASFVPSKNLHSHLPSKHSCVCMCVCTVKSTLNGGSRAVVHAFPNEFAE